MFVPVSCTSCGKPFQVPETALGKLAPCPWCGAAVTALPVSSPLPDQPPAPAAPPPSQPVATAPQPLSLDDAPPAPVQKPLAAKPVAPPSERPVPPAEPPAPAAPFKFNATAAVIVIAVALSVMASTVFLLGYRSGRLPEADWTEFTPPDGSFTVAMPGLPTESDVDPVSDGSLNGGKRYEVRRWYARTAVWVAYNDLDSGLAQKLRSDTDKVVAAGVLRVARDREVTRLQGTNTKEAEFRLDAGWGVELLMETPDGPVVERLVLMGQAKRPRLYVYGVQGKNVTTTSPACRRLLGSFRVNE
jgi:hypothetical protein